MKKMIIVGASLLLAPCSAHAMLQTLFRYMNADLSTATLIETFNEPQTTTYEITEPGIYLLAQDYILTATAAIPAIHIKTSGVQLNLNKRLVAQEGFEGGVVGIKVDENLTGVSVTNGVVGGFTGTALMLGEGANFIQLQNLVFKGCFNKALDFLGTSENPISEVIVEKIVISQCSTDGITDTVVNLAFVDNFYMNDIGISFCGDSNTNMVMFRLSNITKSQLILPVAANNIGSAFTGFDLSNCTTLIVDGAKVINNTSTSDRDGFKGFNFSAGSTGNIFKNMVILNNNALAGDLVGIVLDSGCDDNTFDGIQIVENVGVFVRGFDIENNTGNIINASSILRNRAGNGVCTGIEISGASNGIIEKTNIGYNTTNAGIATGLLIDNGDNWTIRQCQFFHNNGPDAANTGNIDSFGVNLQMGTNDIFIQNVAFNNGANPLNQLAGVPVGSQTILDPALMNTAVSAWTNIAVIQPLIELP